MFINEKEYLQVRHNREMKMVFLTPKDFSHFTDHVIRDVELLVYNNDIQPTEWKDEGPEVEYLKKQLESHKTELSCEREITKQTTNHLRSLACDCERWVQHYGKDMPEEVRTQMLKEALEEKAFANDNGKWLFRREYMASHQKPEELEADEVARLNDVIDKLSKELDEVRDLSNRQNNAHMRLMERNLWQRIINKKTWL